MVNNKQFNFKLLFIQIGILVLFMAVWEIAVKMNLLDPFYTSSPIRIFKYIFNWVAKGNIFWHLWVTLSEALVGLFIGIMLGLFFGYFFAAVKMIDLIFQPFIGIVNALPRIAFAPLIILWFGFGFISKVIIVVSLVFFVVFLNVYNGFKSINPLFLKNAYVLGATKSQIIMHIYLPATTTWLFASLRLSIGYSVIAAIIGEYIGSSAGIGFLIDNAQSMFDSTGVMAGLFILTATVAVIDYFVRCIEHHFEKWK